MALKRKIKLVAIDMDGTLLDSEGKIPEKNKDRILKAEQAGVKVLLSTGRIRMTAADYAKSLRLSSYMITANGSEIWDGNGHLVERSLIDTTVMSWLWNLSRQYKLPFWAISSDKIWDNEMPEDHGSVEWLKCRFEIENDQIREKVWEQLYSAGKLEISNSSPTNIEVNALGINKAMAIEKVCGFLSITMKEVMAIGDSLNDMAMIREAGIGVAMGNAQQPVQAAADWVTAANDEHGVAKAIDRYVLGRQ
ncbi:MAG: Cof-type HAD-IIB family hydrolase [Bacillus sp. (in: firmicutes)]